MKTLINKLQRRKESGYALPMVLVFAAIGLVTMAAALNRTSQSSVLNERKNQLSRTINAAEAATEKILGEMLFDFKVDGERRVFNRIEDYKSTVPTAEEDGLWGDYLFTDHRGNSGKTHVTRIAASTYTDLNSKYKGLKGFASTYRIVSNAREKTGRYAITNAVMQEIQLASIPVFQFAIFYNSLLEFTWAAPLTIRGRVHANSNIYTGSSAPLTLTEDITATGIIQKRGWAGYSLSAMNGSITYQGRRDTNVNSLTLPIGTNNTAAAVREILYRPPAGERQLSPIGQQRFYNKAEMTLIVHDGGIDVKVKTPYDTSPTIVAATNVTYFVNTGSALRDDREAKVVRLTDIDVGKFRTWAATNSAVIRKLGANTPPNILFVEDARTTTSTEMTAVRLVNGRTLPSRGLTVATPNPLYLKGHYNQPNNSFLNTTNTSNVKPASLISDAITILSPNWTDGSMSDSGSGASSVGGSGSGGGSVMGAPRSGSRSGSRASSRGDSRTSKGGSRTSSRGSSSTSRGRGSSTSSRSGSSTSRGRSSSTSSGSRSGTSRSGGGSIGGGFGGGSRSGGGVSSRSGGSSRSGSGVSGGSRSGGSRSGGVSGRSGGSSRSGGSVSGGSRSGGSRSGGGVSGGPGSGGSRSGGGVSGGPGSGGSRSGGSRSGGRSSRSGGDDDDDDDDNDDDDNDDDDNDDDDNDDNDDNDNDDDDNDDDDDDDDRGGLGGPLSGGVDVGFGGTPNTPSLSRRQATDTTINAAILTGVVYSGGPTGESPRSGGVVNYPRLLADWGNGSERLTINGSIVSLFDSARATAPFRRPGNYYYAPTRNFNFDPNFRDVTKLPPGTPELRTLIRSNWKNVLPGKTN